MVLTDEGVEDVSKVDVRVLVTGVDAAVLNRRRDGVIFD
jgi:hypothetical protein